MASCRLPLKTVMRRFATQTGSVFVQHFWRSAFRFDSILLLPDRLGQLWPECTATNSATPWASKSSRCRPIQPRIESLCRATSGFLLIRGVADCYRLRVPHFLPRLGFTPRRFDHRRPRRTTLFHHRFRSRSCSSRLSQRGCSTPRTFCAWGFCRHDFFAP